MFTPLFVQMMKQNSIYFELMRVATERLLFAAVANASSTWRTYFLLKLECMVGDKVDKYNPLDMQPLVDYRICMDVEVGGFYATNRSEDERPSQSMAGEASTQGLRDLEGEADQPETERSTWDDNATARTQDDQEEMGNDDVVVLDASSEVNDEADPSETKSDNEILATSTTKSSDIFIQQYFHQTYLVYIVI